MDTCSSMRTHIYIAKGHMYSSIKGGIYTGMLYATQSSRVVSYICVPLCPTHIYSSIKGGMYTGMRTKRDTYVVIYGHI